MRYEYKSIKFFAQGGDALKAAEILREEIESRTGAMPQMADSEEADISLIADPNGLRDGYKIEQNGSRLVFRARGIRGLIFAIGMFGRKNHAHTGYRRRIQARQAHKGSPARLPHNAKQLRRVGFGGLPQILSRPDVLRLQYG